jgi:DNA-binding NtrC family response regulator
MQQSFLYIIKKIYDNKFMIPSEYYLIVEDDFIMINLYKLILKSADIENLLFCESLAEAKNLIKKYSCITVLLDINLPDGNGLDYLSWHNENYPHIPVIIVTSDNSEEVELSCSTRGAFDFFVKPFNRARLLTSLRNAQNHYDMKKEISDLSHILMSPETNHHPDFSDIITSSPLILRIFKYVEAVSPSKEPILIQGESGTGKELFAKAIHESSHNGGPLISVNVSGLDDNMFSDSLFGHEKGAYTGASSIRKGLIQEAAEGTLFLDEIGDLNLQSQVKLLRLLQEGEYFPLGSDKPKRNKARIITATNIDLNQKIIEGIFRKDLYYRLIPHSIKLPPLRERKEDILLLFNHFIKKLAQELNIEPPLFPKAVNDYLLSHPFPGNIRELKGITHDLIYRSTMGPLRPEDFPHIFHMAPSSELESQIESSLPDQIDFELIMEIYGRIPTLDEVENMLISEALKLHKGNQKAAALMLGVSQSKISRWIKKRQEEKGMNQERIGEKNF